MVKDQASKESENLMIESLWNLIIKQISQLPRSQGQCFILMLNTVHMMMLRFGSEIL